MALEDYRADMARCSRCSYCKFIPFAQVKSWRFSKGCPSIEYGKFQAYSAGGRLSVALALLEERFTYDESESLLDSCLGANGAIYALRGELFPFEIPDNTIVDDFAIGPKVSHHFLA